MLPKNYIVLFQKCKEVVAKIYQCNSATRKLNDSFGLLLVCPQMRFPAIVFVEHANEAGLAASGLQARSQKN